MVVKNYFFNDLEPKEGVFKGEIFYHLCFRIKAKQIGSNLIFRYECAVFFN